MSATSDPRLSTGTSTVARRFGTAGALRVGLDRAGLSLLAGWHGAALDRRLAAGIDPRTSDVLALRARRITRRRNRTRLANGLTGALASARRTRPGLTSAVRTDAAELTAADGVIAELDRCLRGPDPVSAQGVAILRALLIEGSSALYQPGEPGELAWTLRIAAATLGSG